jgi:two-component system phosphate regulon response regulator PhoB
MSQVILLAGLEAEAVEALARYLEEGGLEAILAASGRDALAAIEAHRPSVVVLHHPLADMPGIEALRRIRRGQGQNDVPVILLSEQVEEIDRVIAFEVGADDFVGKPWVHRELALRILAVLRRYRPPRAGRADHLELGPFRIDVARHRVVVDGDEISLTALEFRLLLDLAQHRGRVQQRQDLLERVWRYPGEIETRTVDTHVKRLREKLGPAGRWIETVRGVGYRMRDAS